MQANKTSRIQEIFLSKDKDISLFIKREDELHPIISGNKYRKLKYNLIEAKNQEKNTILSFGGAFSNHIAAIAYASEINGFNSVGVIRGEELVDKIESNPTLNFAKSCGMKFFFVSRETYRNKNHQSFTKELQNRFGDFYLVPEGGTNELAVKGCEEILKQDDRNFNFICTSVGTGGTISGLVNASDANQKILGFPALKVDFLKEDIRKFANQKNWELITDYHFGGYGKIKPELITFINSFKDKFGIPLDPIYTGKMMYGIFDLMSKDYFPKNSKVLVIHTGGLQGIKGMNLRLKQKNLPLIKV